LIIAGPTDDFRERSGSLSEAKERYRSVGATVRHRRHGDLATEAINHCIEYGFRHGILSNLLVSLALVLIVSVSG
jgi:hypothetical protein